MTDIEIREDDLTGTRIRAFLREHLDNMHAITPPESVHALDLDGLRAPGITFWSAWQGSRSAARSGTTAKTRTAC